jgi:gas vesicle protein
MGDFITKLAWFVAGADNTIVKELPNDDRRFISQLGVALSLTFVLRVLIIFGSLYYMAAEYDVVVNDAGIDLQKRIDTIRLGVIVAISVIIALMITLLDRNLIMHDWYNHGYYAASSDKWYEIVWRTLKRWFQASLRIGLSVSIAYVLSQFMLLWFFEAEVESKLQQAFSRRSDSFDRNVTAYKNRLTDEIRRLEEELERTRSDYEKAGSVQYLAANNPNLKLWKADLESARTRLKSIDTNLTNLQRPLRQAQRRLECIEQQIMLEERSEKRVCENICGKQWCSSGTPGRGPWYRTLQAQRYVMQNQVKSLQSEYQRSYQALSRRKQKLEQDIADLRSRIDSELNDLNERLRNEIESHRSVLKNKMDDLQKKIDVLRKTYDTKVKEFQHNFVGKHGVSYKDGVTVRNRILKELFEDPEYGQERKNIALLFELVIIFIEVFAVFIKVFLSIPSAYAVAIQERKKAAVRRWTEASIDSNDAMRQ